MRSFGDSVEVSLFTLHRTSRLVSFWKKNRGRHRTICEARFASFSSYRAVGAGLVRTKPTPNEVMAYCRL
ncbi:MAG: hypothetical protein AUI36_01210 [Cyanobacteria bacterium 13_1_40CM_2_61_4]|nr:MAG: hypothetical protein AUI36_01210 [Cyanobacteria bacterium 13_1_40CM_2_61_4]